MSPTIIALATPVYERSHKLVGLLLGVANSFESRIGETNASSALHFPETYFWEEG